MFMILEQCYNTLMEENEQQWYDGAGAQSAYQAPMLQPVKWSASEFVSHQKSASWYVSLGSVSAVITLIIFLVTKNLLSAIVVAMAFMALGVLAARKPQTKTYEIGEEGIHIDSQSYPYSMFKSFSIMEDGAIDCIWLRPLKRFMPTVVMYYGPEDEEKIVMMLDNFLPQEDRQHDIVERLSRRIRF
jgi:hypothetical protein